MSEEKIIWTGQPIYKPRVAIIEIFGGGWGPFAMILTVVFMSILFFTVFLFVTGETMLGVFCAFVFLAIIFLPEILKKIRRKKTRYTVTNKHVIFELWWWGVGEKHLIPLQSIKRFHYVEFKDKSGQLHLVSKEDFDFKTRNFWSGLSHRTICFDDIPNVVELSEYLNSAIKDQNNLQLSNPGE